MFARSVLIPLSLLIALQPASGQVPSTSEKPIQNAQLQPPAFETYVPLLEERLAFIREMYQLNDAQTSQAGARLKGLLAAHAAYMKVHGQTLRLRRVALTQVLPAEALMKESIRTKLIAKYENEVAKLEAEAPLSLANVIKQVEPMLDPTAVRQGRQRIAEKFREALAGKPLDVTRIDRLIAAAVEPTRPVAAKRPPAKPAVAKSPQTASRTPPVSPVAPPKPPVRRTNPPPAPKPAKPLEPAPPVDQWAEAFEAAVNNYGFTEGQKQRARDILKSCRARAESHLEKNKESYAQAKKKADAAERAKALRRLNARLDKLYEELNRRMKAIPSQEQILSAKSKAKTKAGSTDASKKQTAKQTKQTAKSSGPGAPTD